MEYLKSGKFISIKDEVKVVGESKDSIYEVIYLLPDCNKVICILRGGCTPVVFDMDNIELVNKCKYKDMTLSDYIRNGISQLVFFDDSLLAVVEMKDECDFYDWESPGNFENKE